MTQPHEGVGSTADGGTSPSAPDRLGYDGTSTVGSGTAPGVTSSEGSTKDAAATQAGNVAADAKTEAASVAGDTKDGGRRAGEAAASEARDVAAHASEEAHGLLQEAGSELSSQAGAQQDRLVGLLGSVSEELSGILDPHRTDYSRGVVTDLAEQANARLHEATSWLENREPRDVLEEVARFARRRPGAFLALAGITGFAVGRLTRGITDDARENSDRDHASYRPSPNTGPVSQYVDSAADPYSSFTTTTPVETTPGPHRVTPPTAGQTFAPEAGPIAPGEVSR